MIKWGTSYRNVVIMPKMPPCGVLAFCTAFLRSFVSEVSVNKSGCRTNDIF